MWNHFETHRVFSLWILGGTGGEGPKRPIKVSERSGRDSRTQRRECEGSFFNAFLLTN